VDSKTWQDIRALRATPTGAAATDPNRRRTFAAALKQAEELAEAAQQAGYASKALPLFYSLSQAGRAITAAHLPGQWMLYSHGLEVRWDASTSLLETRITPNHTKAVNSFAGVAAAIGSPVLNGKATLGELWAANPDLLDAPIPTAAVSYFLPAELAINTPYLPAASENEQINTGGMVLMSAIMDGKTGSDIAARVARYPSLRGTFALKQGPNGLERAGPGDVVVQGTDGRGRPVTNLAVEIAPTTTRGEFWRRERELVSVLDREEYQPAGPPSKLMAYALPEVGGGPSPLPLMLWWALLLGLSDLARYDPARWTAAIDLDASELAVGLERVLDIAEQRVPVRILQGLRNQAHPERSLI
jgi:YaaC-like Protein